MEKQVTVEGVIYDVAPDYNMIYLEADVQNHPSDEALRQEMMAAEREIKEKFEVSQINKIPAIAATRAAYKALGKDPNRYRPSQEQLMRRVVRGLGLYYIDSLVDTGNLISLLTGWSIGMFDRDKIEGDALTLGVGQAGEPYEGIGRGPLNVEGLPIVRDAVGGIATPTSDNERTKVDADTRHISVCYHIFDSKLCDVESLQELIMEKLTRHCSARNIDAVRVCANSGGAER